MEFGWIAAVITALGTAALGIYAAKLKADGERSKAEAAAEKARVEARLRESKAEAAAREKEYSFLFREYDRTVTRIRKEHEEDKILLTSLQADHVHCCEERAGLRVQVQARDTELASKNTEIADLKRLIRSDGGGK